MNRYQLIFLFILAAIFLTANPGLAGDDLGIYWDTNYTENSILTDTFPSVHTGYLVLKDPTSALGVSGWECCLGVEGPAIFISWVLEGQTLNLEIPPCFQVGISAPPLPGGDATLLATFMTMVSEELPVTFTVEPLFNPTLPGQMAYTPADDPGNPRPMISVTGNPEVAWINNNIPLLEIDRDHILFDITHIDYPKTESVLVSNLGYFDVDIEVFLSDTSGVFSLPGPTGLVTVPARDSIAIDVLFSPIAAEYYTCTLSLGSLLPDVLIEGTGMVGTISWEMLEHLEFGEVKIGEYRFINLDIHNTGDVPIPIHPVLPDSCSVYDIFPAGQPTTLGPGGILPINVKFQPLAVQDYPCTMTMGEILPDVTFFGSGCNQCLAWIAPTELVMGEVGIGYPLRKGFEIRNIGNEPFFVDPTLPPSCGEYSIVAGAGLTEIGPGGIHIVEIEFAPVDLGISICSLDLGEVIPPVTLSGEGRDPVLIWQAPTQLDFGDVPLGGNLTRTFSVVNIGDLPFAIDVGLPGSCPEFVLTQGEGHWVLDRGMLQVISVRFTPAVLGSTTCLLDLGAVVPSVLLTAVGTGPVLDWTITGPDYDPTAIGEISDGIVTIHNTGDIPFLVDPSIIDPCLHFVLNGVAATVTPGASLYLDVDFAPAALGSLSCVLDLGDVLPDVPLLGEGAEPFLDWTITGPSYIPTGVGETDGGAIDILNTGNVTFNVNPSIIDPCYHFDLRSGGFDLRPGRVRSMWVDFRPTAPGSLSCVMDLGDVLPDVPLLGEAYPRPEGWSIAPLSVNFPYTFVDDFRDEQIVFQNTGGTTISLDIRLDPPDPHFSIPQGGGQLDVLPGYSHDVWVRYEPHSVGSDTTAVLFGAAFPPIPVTGLAVDKDFTCLVQPDTLDFGSLMLGQSLGLPFSVTNLGNQVLEVSPLLDSPHFLLEPGDTTLDPGQSINYVATFFPLASGPHEITIDLGDNTCLDVLCQGTGLISFLPGENLVGMFFDPEFTALEFQTSAVPEIVTGYLVLSQPSKSTGVGAWECAYDLTGNGQYLGWQFEGQAINAGNFNNLIIGIGGTPLPFGPTILLATFQILVPSPADELDLILRPTQFPSIPGQMAWAPGGQPGVLLPMIPFTGRDIVAWINQEVVAVDPLVPVATGLLPNVPNPFNPSTRIRFELAARTHVRVTIYDVTGRSILTLVDDSLEAGPHTRIWRGRDSANRQVPSGPYFVRLVTEKRVDVRKVLLLK